MTARERIDNAKDHVKNAIQDLSEIIVNECWGTDELSEERLDELANVMQRLIDIRRIL